MSELAWPRPTTTCRAISDFCHATSDVDTVRLSQCDNHSLANCDSCPSPAKSEAIEYLQVGPTEIRYSIAWTIFVYL